ncbi:Cadmium, cobalt and zinc/H(+)-K(+) antiporter [Rubripirellula tenax]|uniref:Cadmium, cobalt and zinc/H(+)-K(+) antiporter n=1 Tax=Rubripirellula tenax TaxID=2528015 RepID=A0A5C6FB96_9BACT|nr:cation diffusion facilitator family transporter [Rubripirellula tenax]TWU56849.1 Cadmium, cobalt and zinc/H(+)-K(+) antiporter [Rubripirellula tenax]
MHQCAHHHATEKDFGRAFAFGVTLNVVFVVIEAAIGWWSDSLALMADAGHNLSDVLGLLMAWAGYALAKLPPSGKRTYGWRGSTILAALFNSLLLMVAVGGIVWEAIGRLSDPPAVPGPIVIVVAMIGVVINTATALLFIRGSEHDLNLRGAYLHMAADALLSLGVAIAGAIILWTDWRVIDPVASLAIAAVIFFATWKLMRESFQLAMQAVPAHIDIEQVQTYLGELAGVTAVHDLHIWAMSTTENALTAHLVRPGHTNDDVLLNEISKTLHERFKIDHITIQIERSVGDANCGQWEEGTL